MVSACQAFPLHTCSGRTSDSLDQGRHMRGKYPTSQHMLHTAWLPQPLLHAVSSTEGENLASTVGGRRIPDRSRLCLSAHVTNTSQTSYCTEALPEVLGQVLKSVLTQEPLTFNCKLSLNLAHDKNLINSLLLPCNAEGQMSLTPMLCNQKGALSAGANYYLAFTSCHRACQGYRHCCATHLITQLLAKHRRK